MAAVTALAIASLATAAVGTGIAIYGQRQAAKTSQAVGEFNAQQGEENARQVAETADYNARLLENQALQTEMDARENIRRKRAENKRYASMQRARFAASGVTEEGSPLEVMSDTAALLEMDALEVNRQAQIRMNELRAGASETRRTGTFQADQYRKQAGFDRQYGSAQARAANIASVGTLLQGASNIAGAAYTFRRQGAI